MRVDFDFFSEVMWAMKSANQYGVSRYIIKHPNAKCPHSTNKPNAEDVEHVLAVVRPHPSCINHEKQQVLLNLMNSQNVILEPELEFEAPNPDLQILCPTTILNTKGSSLEIESPSKFGVVMIDLPKFDTEVNLNFPNGKSAVFSWQNALLHSEISFNEPVVAANLKNDQHEPAESPKGEKDHIRSVQLVLFEFE